MALIPTMALPVSCWLLVLMAMSGMSLTTMGDRFSILPPPHPDQPDNVPDNQLVYVVQLPGKPVVAAFGDVFNNTQKAGASRSKDGRRIKGAKDYSANLTTQQTDFLAKSLKKGTYRTIKSFTYCLNAVSVRLTSPSQVSVLQKAMGVRLERDTKLESHTTHTPTFLGLDVPSSGGWSLAGGGPDGAGEGIIIGLVDTGVTPTHDSLADDLGVPYSRVSSSFVGACQVNDNNFPAGSCNNKLVGAQYFATSAIAYGFLDPTDFLSPLDGNGHGSHTSAIAAGNNDINVSVQGQDFGIASGMAPRARVATYKCIYRFGGLLSDCIAAIQQAVVDGVNIINLSLGPSAPPAGVTFLSSFDLAMLQAVQSGAIVLQSAGNYGPYSATLSSFSPWIISVGSSTTDRTYPVYLTLGNGRTLTGRGYSGGPLDTSLLVSSADAAFSDSDSGYIPTDCQVSDDLDGSLVEGKVLLCFYSENFEAGSSVVSQVAITARQLNASGFVLVAADDSLYFPIFYDPLPFQIPGAFLTDLTSSQALVNYFNSNSSTASVSISIPPGNYYADFSSVGPVVSDFSSRGPVPSDAATSDTADVMKPDLIAPGENIWSAWTTDGVDLPYWNSDFASRSGTSQASPHVAGVAALIKQKHPTWSPAAVQSALVTSAKKLASNGEPINARSDLDSPLAPANSFDMGGGFVNPSAAIDPGLIFDRGYQDYINFLCAVPNVDPQTVLQLTGSACNRTTVSGAALRASDLNMPSITVANLQKSRQVGRTVTSVATVAETYTSTIVVPNGVSLSVSPSQFTISPGSTASFTAVFNVIGTRALKQFTYGSITWTGNAGHVVVMPVSVFPASK